MVALKDLRLRYLTDDTGRKVSVVLDLEQFDELMEDFDDLAAIAERRDEPTRSHDDVVEELNSDL